MSSFVLRPPKLFVAYLSRSPHSIVSDEQCSVSYAECTEYANLLRTLCWPDNSCFEQGETGTANVREDVDQLGWSYSSAKRQRISVEQEPQLEVLRRAFRGLKSLGITADDPVALHYSLEQTHALRLARPSPITLPHQPPIPRPLPPDRIFKGDIIVCIRDEFKPPVENLISAYAINAELLRNTMEYFRTALLNTTEEQEAHGIQISLYVPKDLWEWLLHLAKIQYRQTRERLPVIKKSLALPLFSTAVLLGIKEAREICLRYLKQKWPSAILERDRSLEHVTANGVLALAQAVDPDYVELSVDHSDWLVEKFYGIWVQEILEKEEGLNGEFFPLGSAMDMLICQFCRKWMNEQLAAILPCFSKVTVRGEDGRMAYAHSRLPGANFKGRVDELKKEFGTSRSLFWNLYGLLNVLMCTDCHQVFQLAEVSHCRYHPCEPEKCPGSLYDVMIYPCCQRATSRVDKQKDTGCGFKDHRIDSAALNQSDKRRHQRLLSFQRFMWVSPRKSADNLSDPENPAFLPDEIQNSAQDLLAATWDPAKPVWSNQDCMRQEEKKSIKLLKEYLKNLAKAPLSSTQKLPNQTSKDQPAEEEEKPIPPPPDSARESTSTRQLSAKQTEQAVRSAALNKGGPFSGRNRYVPNLVLPAYRGVFTRISREWTSSMDALIAAEDAVQAVLDAEKVATAVKAHLSSSSAAVFRKPVVQKIPLRKVTCPLKPPEKRLRTAFDREMPAMRATHLHHHRRSIVGARRSMLKRQLRQQQQEPRSRQRVKQPAKQPPTRSPKKPVQTTDADRAQPLSDLGDHLPLTLTNSSDNLPNHNGAPPQHQSPTEQFIDLAKLCFRSNSSFGLAFSSNESFRLSSDAASTYPLKLVRKLNRPEPCLDYSDEQNEAVARRFLERVQAFLKETAALREELFADVWRRLQLRALKRRGEKAGLGRFATVGEGKRYRRRLIRLYRYLDQQRSDAFTQPRTVASASERAWEQEVRRGTLDRLVADAEQVWRKKIKKLIGKRFPGETRYLC
ncbi:KIAA1841-like protein [Hypsibius exemplaris]|uniref:KIAA1841-like protein n=1 Tax=Hypsibius exemplaris TaxID=2072580 RepID=A0A1W0WLF1_HYPEX|nr:KIAA1841-like protein [Hypsibius exemplaris]